MKKNKILAVVSIVCVIITLATVTLAATGGLTEIKAYLNHDIKVYYNGELKKMYDVNGKEVFPVSYQGTTYVPIRAVSNMIGLNVDWDGATKSVLLGKTGVEKDFIEEFTPYATVYTATHRKISDGKSFQLGDKTYNHYIYLSGCDKSGVKYDIAGQYTTFSFFAYGTYDSTFYVLGDNDSVLATIEIKGKSLPKQFIVDVTGTQQLTIMNLNENQNRYWDNDIHILDAKIK